MQKSLAEPQRILIVTPAKRGSRGGNRTTALRWAGLLRSSGHHVRVRTAWDGQGCDVLIAVHAAKTAAAVAEATAGRPQLQVVVLLAGTDIYPTFADDPATRAALLRADALVALQPNALDLLPAEIRPRATSIVQSATAAPAAGTTRADRFTVVMLAHIRPVKQQLVALEALAAIPNHLDVRMVFAGGELDRDYSRRFRAAVAANPRATWIGECSRQDSKRLLAEAHLCLVPSSAEGGANVISESLAAGTAIACSAIPGNLGLLGEDWPAQFPAGNAHALAELLQRIRTDRAFLDSLGARTRALQPMVEPAAERAAWAALLATLRSQPPRK
ncbi:MAG: glycosyltransferase family 4 protein [Planctomycetota bacterium]